MYAIKLAELPSDSRTSRSLLCHSRQVEALSSIWDICKLLKLGYQFTQGSDDPGLQFHHRRFRAGDRVYRPGQIFESLYVVRFGYLKVALSNPEGDERILSFPMRGNLLGSEGICDGIYQTESIALTDCELIVIPFRRLLAAVRIYPELEGIVYMSISRELTEERVGASLSSPLRSQGRVALFLETIARRHAACGYSSKEILLPMTRHDVGCHLGLTLETVSRALSALAATGAIAVRRKNIRILKPELLRLIQTHSDPQCREERPVQSPDFRPVVVDTRSDR